MRTRAEQGVRLGADARGLLFFFVAGGGFFGLAAGPLVLGFCGFHGLASFFRPFGADLGALLALLVQRLLAAEKLDERDFSAIAPAETALNDAHIAAFTVAEAWRDGIEQLGYSIARHQVRRGLPPRRHITTLAEGDHLLHVRAHGLGLGQGGLNALFRDQRGYQVAQQRAPVFGVPSQLPSCSTMTHFRNPSSSGDKAPYSGAGLKVCPE